MKLRPEEIELIVDRLIVEWKTRRCAMFHKSDRDVRLRLIDTFTKELAIEDEINKAADALLAKYEKEFQSGKLDRRKMFQMVKNQLIKERKVVL